MTQHEVAYVHNRTLDSHAEVDPNHWLEVIATLDELIPSPANQVTPEVQAQTIEGVRTAYRRINDLLVATARATLADLGLPQDYEFREPKDIPVKFTGDEPRGCLARNIGSYDCKNNQSTFWAKYFPYHIAEQHEDGEGRANPIGPTLLTLASTYAEECVMHPLARWYEVDSARARDIFLQVLKDIYRHYSTEILLQPHTSVPFGQSITDATVAYSGFKSYFFVEGKNIWLRHSSVLDEMFVKNFVGYYMLKMRAFLGLDFSPEYLLEKLMKCWQFDTPDPIPAYPKVPTFRENFIAARQFITQRKQSIASVYARDGMLQSIVEFLAQSSRRNAIDFTLATLVGDGPKAIGYMSSAWDKLSGGKDS